MNKNANQHVHEIKSFLCTDGTVNYMRRPCARNIKYKTTSLFSMLAKVLLAPLCKSRNYCVACAVKKIVINSFRRITGLTVFRSANAFIVQEFILGGLCPISSLD